MVEKKKRQLYMHCAREHVVRRRRDASVKFLLTRGIGTSPITLTTSCRQQTGRVVNLCMFYSELPTAVAIDRAGGPNARSHVKTESGAG